MKDLDINAAFKANGYLGSKNKGIEIKDKFNMFNIPSNQMNESSHIDFQGYDREYAELQGGLQKQDGNVRGYIIFSY
jgi:hypothetical protein